MVTRRFQRTRKLDYALIQIMAMRSKYPEFTVKARKPDYIEFEGCLFIKPEMPIYKVSITYRGNKTPLARIIAPALVEKPPHFYQNEKALCLYHPANFKWDQSKLIARDIVPWVASWIYFYEVWLEHGKWYGPEAKHNINTSKKL